MDWRSISALLLLCIGCNLPPPTLDFTDDLCESAAQCTSERIDIQEGDVRYASLDSADEGAVKSSLFRKVVLIPTPIEPSHSDLAAKYF
jgi:hypothetical protein